MLLQDVWNLLSRDLFSIPSTDTLFNQYRDSDPVFDRSSGASIRRQNLKKYLESYSAFPKVFLIGEAPGFHGCRFSGVPFTSEQQLVSPNSLPFSGRQSSVGVAPRHERTADVFWQVMRPHFPEFLVWNIVPFHPHKSNDHMSNRNPSASEAKRFEGIIKTMASIIQPRIIIAIGKTAEHSLARWQLKYETIRHPSHGGSAKFALAIPRYFNRE